MLWRTCSFQSSATRFEACFIDVCTSAQQLTSYGHVAWQQLKRQQSKATTDSLVFGKVSSSTTERLPEKQIHVTMGFVCRSSGKTHTQRCGSPYTTQTMTSCAHSV
eukprot:2009796-Amphidinium_carterae.1